jgi:hypothetical protein
VFEYCKIFLMFERLYRPTHISSTTRHRFWPKAHLHPARSRPRHPCLLSAPVPALQGHHCAAHHRALSSSSRMCCDLKPSFHAPARVPERHLPQPSSSTIMTYMAPNPFGCSLASILLPKCAIDAMSLYERFDDFPGRQLESAAAFPFQP